MKATKTQLFAKVRELGLVPPARATKAELQEILDTAAMADVVDLTEDVPAGSRATSSARRVQRCPAGRPLFGELCRDCVVSGLDKCPGG